MNILASSIASVYVCMAEYFNELLLYNKNQLVQHKAEITNRNLTCIHKERKKEMRSNRQGNVGAPAVIIGRIIVAEK